ncbi:hypothetical protein BDM02DRAFT_2546805 [Thelephora ganbajun]|uniref:Uncharacterized protein n=1 Tax=Thelephora ganbajun TaxID=370292 RepID=A0ACB6ZTK6_THEGA|nr:hypothetical protein BDM02DRAFT_2546805 [Thelephora ganbajun]
MRARAASSAGHSDTSRPAADVRRSSSLLQTKASRFFKNLSNFARGRKDSSGASPYNTNGRHTQTKPYLSQPALVISDFSPEQDESSSSISPSPQSGSSPLNGGVPSTLGAGFHSLGLAGGGRDDRTNDSAQPTSAGNTRLPPETPNHNGRSPNFLTLPTSPASGRSVSFDIPRSPSSKEDKRSKCSGFETMSPPRNLDDVPGHRSPYQIADTPSPNLSGAGWSSTTSLRERAPKIEGLPDLGEFIDPNLFKYAQPTGQPVVDEVLNLTPNRTPTPPSSNPMPSNPPNYHEATNSPVLTPANFSPAILPPKRVALLRLESLPPPAFTVNNEDGSVRLSPAAIGRHFTTAVRPLPPTSIVRRSSSPAPSLRSNASQVRLRSVPALAIDGTEDGDGDGSGDDEDDNDDDHVPITSSPASEDEDEDAATEREEGSSTYVSTNIPPEDPHPGPSTPSRFVDGDKTPVFKHSQDYFSIHSTRSDSVNWMPSGSNPKRVSLTPKERPAALYHQASKSMVNLLSGQRRDLSIIDEETKGKGKVADSVSSAVATETNILPEGSRIQRRRSLPTFTAATEPPPYPSLEIPAKFAPKVFPRDEEGKEHLPAYSNGILLSAVLPRKLEFSSPGVQARDRKWRRALCVLEGTVFRVYEPPSSAVGIGAVGRWWEKKVGVGDLTSDAPLSKKTRTSTPGSQKIDQDLDGDEDRLTVGSTPGIVASERETVSPANKLKSHPPGFLHRSGTTSGTPSRRQSGETPREDGRNGLSAPASRPSMSSIVSNTTGRPSTSSHKRAASPASTKSAQPGCFPYPQNCEPLRVYTLQHAESGLASDYLKRKNVIRVRMEGEQFLLQAPSVQTVVDWIEGFQTATGIALDLDERQMPKGPIFPRYVLNPWTKFCADPCA